MIRLFWPVVIMGILIKGRYEVRDRRQGNNGSEKLE